MGTGAYGRVETQVSPFPPGSGRKMDYTFPDWNANATGAVTNQIRDRPGAQAANPAGSITGGATGTSNVGFVQGVPCVRMINGANLNGGNVCIVDGAGRLHLRTLSANNLYSTSTDDYAVHRVYMIARMVATPADATDVGLQIVLGAASNAGILKNVVPGIGIQFDNTGNCSYLQHGNSGAVTSANLQTVAQGFVNTDWHMFEFVFINATSQSNGSVKVKLDGFLKLTKAFGSVPDDLPLPSSAGANVNNGYVVNFQAQSRNCEMDVAMVRVQRGPTEQAVLS